MESIIRLRIMVLAVALPAMMMLMAASGCGDSPGADGIVPDQPGSQIDIDVGANADGQGADAVLLFAEDLSMEVGSERVYSANSPRSLTHVSFDLEGPWDFADGADSMELTMEWVEVDSASGYEYFPDATVAIKSSWEPGLIEERYSFQSIDEEEWRAYGSSDAARYIIFSQPSLALMFPAAVGDSWLDTYQKTEDGTTVRVKAENEVLAYNMLTVPAGEFEAFLLKTTVTVSEKEETTTTINYVWLVPGVGRAAEIVSQPGEDDEIFDRAYAFYRLESYKDA